MDETKKDTAVVVKRDNGWTCLTGPGGLGVGYRDEKAANVEMWYRTLADHDFAELDTGPERYILIGKYSGQIDAATVIYYDMVLGKALFGLALQVNKMQPDDLGSIGDDLEAVMEYAIEHGLPCCIDAPGVDESLMDSLDSTTTPRLLN